MADNIIIAAAKFAAHAHRDQKRKYNGRPYITHPARVAARISYLPSATPEMVAAAWCHDVLEDCAVIRWDLDPVIGATAAQYVEYLTNQSKGSKLPRADRKKMDREHLAKCPTEVKCIKLADRTDNLLEMTGAPRNFLDLYLEETRLLLPELMPADNDLIIELMRAMEHLGAQNG